MYRFLSVSLYVRTVAEAFADALRWHFEPFRLSGPGPSAPVRIDVTERELPEGERLSPDLEEHAPRYVYARDGRVERVSSLAGILGYALWDVTALVPKRVKDFLFVHAGAVARDGGALLLPALPTAGKSTLTAALLEVGFDYLSDELGAIDPVTSQAYPFEKKVSLKEDSLRFFPDLASRLRDRDRLTGLLPDRFVPPQDLGAAVAGPSPVHWIVFLSPNREGPPRISPLTRAETTRHLVGHTFNLEVYRDRGMVLLSRVASEARGLLLDGGTPPERAQLLSERLS